VQQMFYSQDLSKRTVSLALKVNAEISMKDSVSSDFT